jgi:hypothetical protein
MSSYEGRKNRRVARIVSLTRPIIGHFTPEAMPDLQICTIEMKDLKQGVILTPKYENEESIQSFFTSVFISKGFFKFVLSLFMDMSKSDKKIVNIHTYNEYIYAIEGYKKETVILRKDSPHGAFYIVSKAKNTKEDFANFDELIDKYVQKNK